MATSLLPIRSQAPSPAHGMSPIVYVVDDDVSVREAVEVLVGQSGWRTEAFASARDFLDRVWSCRPSCLVLDISLPDLSGLELQRRLSDARTEMPIVFITGRGDVPMSVQAMKAGAVEFLTKPFEPDALLDAIRIALERSSAFIQERLVAQAMRGRHEALTPREREVMALVVKGLLNKQVGGALGISEITVKAHRGRVMRKMGARSLPALVSLAARLGLETAEGS